MDPTDLGRDPDTQDTAPNVSCSRMAECGVNISLSCLESYTAEELDTKLIPFKQRQFRELQAEAQHIQVRHRGCRAWTK
jgi:hypothetical protein